MNDERNRGRGRSGGRQDYESDGRYREDERAHFGERDRRAEGYWSPYTDRDRGDISHQSGGETPWRSTDAGIQRGYREGGGSYFASYEDGTDRTRGRGAYDRDEDRGAAQMGRGGAQGPSEGRYPQGRPWMEEQRGYPQGGNYGENPGFHGQGQGSFYGQGGGNYGRPGGYYGQGSSYGQNEGYYGQGGGSWGPNPRGQEGHHGQGPGGSPGYSQGARGARGGRGPVNYTRSDERVYEDVCDALSNDDQIDASQVEVKVEKGVLTLTGSVDHREIKNRIEDVVETIRGVKDVNNQIKVRRQGASSSTSQGASSTSTSGTNATPGATGSSPGSNGVVREGRART